MIIGIGGPSQSGKSMLAQRLDEILPDNSAIISQDDFIRPEGDIPQIDGRTNWELPESIDELKLQAAIDYFSKRAHYVIVEGIFAFSYPWLKDMYDRSILISVDKETFFQRRRADTRWGKEPEWYLEYVWQYYQDQSIRAPGPVLYLDQSYNLDEVLSFLDA